MRCGCHAASVAQYTLRRSRAEPADAAYERRSLAITEGAESYRLAQATEGKGVVPLS